MQILQPPSVFFSISGDIVLVWTNSLFHVSSPSVWWSSKRSLEIVGPPEGCSRGPAVVLSSRNVPGPPELAFPCILGCVLEHRVFANLVGLDFVDESNTEDFAFHGPLRCLELLCVGVSECSRLTSVVESRKNGGVEQVGSGLWILNFFEYVLEIFLKF